MFSPIFTEGVWNTSFRSDLKSYCDKIRNTQGGRVLTNKGGYQSNNLNLADPELQPLISHLETEALNYNRIYENTIDSLKVTNLWINITTGFCQLNNTSVTSSRPSTYTGSTLT